MCLPDVISLHDRIFLTICRSDQIFIFLSDGFHRRGMLHRFGSTAVLLKTWLVIVGLHHGLALLPDGQKGLELAWLGTHRAWLLYCLERRVETLGDENRGAGYAHADALKLALEESGP